MSAKKQELSKPSGQGLCFLGMRLSRYAAPQQNVDAIFTRLGGVWTLMTSPASWDSVKQARSRQRGQSPAVGRAVQVLGGKVGVKPRRLDRQFKSSRRKGSVEYCVFGSRVVGPARFFSPSSCALRREWSCWGR